MLHALFLTSCLCQSHLLFLQLPPHPHFLLTDPGTSFQDPTQCHFLQEVPLIPSAPFISTFTHGAHSIVLPAPMIGPAAWFYMCSSTPAKTSLSESIIHNLSPHHNINQPSQPLAAYQRANTKLKGPFSTLPSDSTLRNVKNLCPELLAATIPGAPSYLPT